MAQHLTLNQTARAFGVSLMSLYLWRQGTATKEPLPTVESDGRQVVDAKVARTWASLHGLKFVLKNAGTVGKDGPKPKVKKRRSKPPH